MRLFPMAILLAGVATAGAAPADAPARAQGVGPALTIDGAASRHKISPYIYGMAQYGVDPAFQKEVALPVLRWGGDGTTRYNWMLDSSNAGFDWFFMGGDGNATPTPSGGPDAMVLADRASRSQTLLTIPIIPWINGTSAWTCSFPVSAYGVQQATNPYVHPNGGDCGNSLTTTGAQLLDTDIPANHIPNTPAIQAAWVAHLVGRFGTAAQGGVRFYQMDNEPFGWANTHRDVQPAQPTYDAIEADTEAYAAAVKRADRTALVMGPSDFGWPAYVGNGPEITEHGGLWNAPWYLKKMAAYQAAHHVRLIDYFDEHYYPSGPGDDAWILRSTRSLWDPTYVDESWIGQWFGAVDLIPRMQSWVAQYDPGVKVAISEYSFGAHTTLVGALAEADALGIFGRQGLDFATMWDPPAPTDPVAFSFRLFRNFDGHGQSFGDLSIAAASADQSQLSVYASLRRDNTLVAVLVNKTTTPLSSSFSLANLIPAGLGHTFVYSGADLTAIHAGAAVTFSSQGGATLTLPARSATVLAVTLSGKPYAVAPTPR